MVVRGAGGRPPRGPLVRFPTTTRPPEPLNACGRPAGAGSTQKTTPIPTRGLTIRPEPAHSPPENALATEVPPKVGEIRDTETAQRTHRPGPEPSAPGRRHFRLRSSPARPATAMRSQHGREGGELCVHRRDLRPRRLDQPADRLPRRLPPLQLIHLGQQPRQPPSQHDPPTGSGPACVRRPRGHGPAAAGPHDAQRPRLMGLVGQHALADQRLHAVVNGRRTDAEPLRKVFERRGEPHARR